MPDTKERPVSKSVASKTNRHYRLPPAFKNHGGTGGKTFQTVRFAGTNQDTADAYRAMTMGLSDTLAIGYSGREILAADIVMHTATGGVPNRQSTSHYASNLQLEVESRITNFLSNIGVRDVDKALSDVLNAGPGIHEGSWDMLNSRNGVDKNGAYFTVQDAGFRVSVTPHDSRAPETIKPLWDIRDERFQQVAAMMSGLETKYGTEFGKVSGQKELMTYIPIPVAKEMNLENQQKTKDSLNMSAPVDNQEQYRLNQERLALLALQRDEANRISKIEKHAFHDVFTHISNKIVHDAIEHSTENAKKWGNTSVDENGLPHPYAVKKSDNHEGNLLLSNGVRIPAAGNYWYRQGHQNSLAELKDYVNKNHPDIDYNKFAVEHLGASGKMDYFAALCKLNTAKSENAPTHLLLPYTNIAGKIFGAQVISYDDYSLDKGKVKTTMKGIQIAEEKLSINLGTPIHAGTKLVVTAEGAATADSLAILLFGRDYKNIKELSVIAAISSDNQKKVTSALNDDFKQEFGAKHDLSIIAAIDNDMEKSRINPLARLSYERTRRDFEKGDTNDRNAGYSKLVANAGLEVFKELRAQGVEGVSFITPPSYANQVLSEGNVQNKEYAANHDVVDLNDMIKFYGVEKSREILLAQINALPLDMTRNEQGSVVSVEPKSNAYDNTARDFAIGNALANHPPQQEAFVKAMMDYSPAQNEFRAESQQLAKALHEVMSDKSLRTFVADYVAEVDKNHPNHYDHLTLLRESLAVVHNSVSMDKEARPEDKQMFMTIMLGVHLNDKNIGGDLEKLGIALKEMAANPSMAGGPTSSQNPAYMSSMIHAVNSAINSKDGTDKLNTVYGDYMKDTVVAMDMLSKHYFSYSQEPEHQAKSKMLAHDIVDTVRRRIDPEIIAMQIKDEPSVNKDNGPSNDYSMSPGM